MSIVVVSSCRRPNNPTNGRVELSGTAVGSFANYSCNDGFRLQGAPLRLCTGTGTGEWSGVPPTCSGIII